MIPEQKFVMTKINVHEKRIEESKKREMNKQHDRLDKLEGMVEMNILNGNKGVQKWRKWK